jgi:CheY-like chemotaxis protein
MHARDYCIVVAEDDEALRYCTVHLLRAHGYKIIEARDGIETLELLEKCDDAIHLLVTNYDMPGSMACNWRASPAPSTSVW